MPVDGLCNKEGRKWKHVATPQECTAVYEWPGHLT